MDTSEMQELLLATMPHWHHWIDKPFKKLLDNGMSLGMYYCIQGLRMSGNSMSMTELAARSQCSKQQMTKTVARLIENGYARRTDDPNDRRIIRLELTQEGLDYIRDFHAQDAAYYQKFFDSMTAEEKERFCEALETLREIFGRIEDSSRDQKNVCAGNGKGKCVC